MTPFASAIDAAEHLRHKEGLSAVKRGEGKDRIHQGKKKIAGSVAIDDDCRGEFPRAARWDYVIGVGESAPTAFFVEVHPAETSEVSKLADKLAWLTTFLERDKQAALKKLPREIHWVASGRVNIPKNTPQYKRLTTQLRKHLFGPVTSLKLP